MDHSCDPDTFVFFEGPKILVRALKPDLECKLPSEVRQLDYSWGLGLWYVVYVIRSIVLLLVVFVLSIRLRPSNDDEN
jgi:hypothetical protein